MLIYRYPNRVVDLEGLYQNASCFLLLPGPSLCNYDISVLNNSRGVLYASVNNCAAKLCRPNFWFSVDHPKSFCDSIYFDPFILKFIPEENIDKSFFVRDRNGKFQPANRLVYTLPAVLTYRRNKDFNVKRFLSEPTINWGNEGSITDELGCKGGRSVMFPAFRILYYLGIRRLFLLGCDFNMQPDKPYAFEQTKHIGGCNSNNKAYEIHNKRFIALRTEFERKNFFIYNCTKPSGLTAFDYKSYDEALSYCTREIPKKIDLQNYYGSET